MYTQKKKMLVYRSPQGTTHVFLGNITLGTPRHLSWFELHSCLLSSLSSLLKIRLQGSRNNICFNHPCTTKYQAISRGLKMPLFDKHAAPEITVPKGDANTIRRLKGRVTLRITLGPHSAVVSVHSSLALWLEASALDCGRSWAVPHFPQPPVITAKFTWGRKISS